MKLDSNRTKIIALIIVIVFLLIILAGFGLGGAENDDKSPIKSTTSVSNHTLIITTNITDANGSSVNGGIVAYKLNGKTLKNSKNKTIKTNVTNGSAKLSYKLPDMIKTGEYNLTTVYKAPDNTTKNYTQKVKLKI